MEDFLASRCDISDMLARSLAHPTPTALAHPPCHFLSPSGIWVFGSSQTFTLLCLTPTPTLTPQARAGAKKFRKVTLTVSPKGIVITDTETADLVEDVSIYR